ncbi:hypothetical protein [Tolypothrix sp. NIES-4075]|uniref:hypothetical protein n=1 Tax=Tolypothrix sp. NIES-4075 TaxID=2005459 RepID=UPI00135C136A|nr:hypothetical protein [Tolypothrix sp. NIES-4075]
MVIGNWALGIGLFLFPHSPCPIPHYPIPHSPFPFIAKVVLYRNGLLDCRSELPWTTRSASTDAIKRIWGFSTPIGAASSSVDRRGFTVLRSTIVKETANRQ